MNEEAAVRRVLNVSGVAFPRGVLGVEARALADAIAADADEQALAAAIRRVAAAHWPTLRAPVAAGLARGAARAEEEDREAFAWAESLARAEDPENTLALALAARAGAELAAGLGRAQARLARLGPAVERGDADAAVEVTRAAGEIVVDLLELDPDDFGPEIADYAGEDRGEAGVAALARATGDLDAREWAREALRGLPPGSPARDAVVALAAPAPPEDPSEDVIWVAAVLALAAEGIERAAIEAPDPGANGASGD
jgi:hypothetical protein